jgi:hypothetical protein
LVSAATAVLAFAVSIAADQGAGEVTAQAASTPRIALKATVGKPGSDIRVPVYLDPADASVGSITFRVSFPAAVLTFGTLEVAMRKLQQVAKSATAEPVAGDPAAIEVKMSHDKEPLPSGPLGWLIFRVAQDAPAKEFRVHVTAASGTTMSGEAIGRLESEDAKVVVVDKETAETLLSCFYYMH